MIILDTHIWVWWVHGSDQLTPTQLANLQANEKTGLGISAISCWEVAKLVELNRLVLPIDVMEWLDQALAYPGVQLINLTPAIAAESARLPQPFHRDPADQIIVATARVLDCELLTADKRILEYGSVKTVR